MSVIASKLPHGLTIRHNGQTIQLLGANIGEDLEQVSKNGRPNDNASRYHGYGLTTLDDKQTEAFNDWSNRVQFVDGKKEAGKLPEPFLPLDNGAILGPFKTMDEARKEVASTAGFVTSGFEGLDPKAEGVEEATTDDKKKR